MGAQLPKPVTSKVIDRAGNPFYNVAVAEMNGFRERMEDAHTIDFTETYGCFAVFDGHMDPRCAAYMGEHFAGAIANAKPPLTDETMQQVALDLDRDFIATSSESGSTGTFFIAIQDGSGPGAKYHLQVGNVGDSRVIVGRDGVAHPMTEDHKPSLDAERARIEACGGMVVNSRVDGNLAVSRAFGDSQYKSGDGGQRDQKVIALPDVTHITCTRSDFVVLCCDGVFEGNFSNEQVIEFVAELLKTEDNLGTIAAAVCDEALKRGSKDNITCMLVTFKDGCNQKYPAKEYIPGPFSNPGHQGFKTAYFAMADKVNVSQAATLELRYNNLKKALAARIAEISWDDNVSDFSKLSEDDLKAIVDSHKEPTDGLVKSALINKCKTLRKQGKDCVPTDIREMREELAQTFGEGPGEDVSAADKEKWFQERLDMLTTKEAPGAGGAEAGNGQGGEGAKIVVDASTFNRLQQLQQHTGGQIPLPLLLTLLQAGGGANLPGAGSSDNK